MGFFDNLKKFLGFGGDDEAEKRRRQQQQQQQQNSANRNRGSSTVVVAPNQNSQQVTLQNPLNPPPVNGVNLGYFGATGNTPAGFPTLLNKTQAPATPSTAELKKRELDRLTEESYAEAKRQREQGEGWFGRNLLNKTHIEQDARVSARSRATNKYQEKNGWNNDADVIAYGNETRNLGNRHSEQLRGESERLQKVAKVMDKVGEVAQYVPVTGSVLNLGMAGAERANVGGMKKDIANQRNKNEFGMTTEELKALPQDVQDKLQIVRNVSYGISPLDVTGVGGLVKSASASAAKKAAIELAKKGAVELATKAALKEAAKAEAKKFALTTAVGTGVGVGAQSWIGGADSIDPLAALKGGVMAGGTSLLFDGGPSKVAAKQAAADAQEAAKAASEVAPGVRSINPNQAMDATTQAVDNTPAYMRGIPTTAGQAAGQQSLLGRTNLPDSMFDADARNAQSAVPPDPMDVPTFMRNNAPAKAADAKEQMRMLDERAAAIRQNQGQTAKFNDKQEIAAAFAESPRKGQAVAALVKNRNERNDPEKALRETLSARATASKELADAENARVAQEAIDNAPPAPEPIRPDAVSQRETETLTQLDKASKERVLTNDEKSLRTELRGKTDAINEANNPAPAKEIKPATATPNVASAQTSLPLDAGQTIPNAFPAPAPLAKTPGRVKAPARTPQNELPLVKNAETAKSGEVGKSQGKYARGQEYEKTSLEATRQRGAEGAATESYDTFVKKIDDADGMTGADRDTAVALQARQKVGSPEHRRLGELVNKHNTDAAQTLGTIERVIRQTADANRITDRFVNKLYASTDDTVKINESDFDGIIAKNEAFTTSRDNQNAAVERFNTDPSQANADAVADAFKVSDAADRAAKFEEYKVAAGFNKQSSNPKTAKLVKKLEQDAGVYTMDWVDSSMLSSTRVMINNFINTLGVRNEEAMFGKAGAAIARKLTGTDIGGGSRKGDKLGATLGTANWNANRKIRQGAEGNRLVKAVKNFTTGGNTIGDRNTYAAAYSGVYDHYKTQLKRAGFKGDELDRRAMVSSLSDPDKIAFDYMNQALANNAMASTTSGVTGGKLETRFADTLARGMGNSGPAKVASKAVTRIVLGFPTVIGRSLVAGSKRASLGSVSTVQAINNVVQKGDPAVTAKHIKQAVKEAGSGATMYAVGAGLGFAGVITGGYPSDQEERDRWKREGISENSIKIGKDYYSLPAALGVFALPFMMGANVASNVQEGKKPTDDFIMDTVKTVLNAAPTDSVAKTLDFFQDLEAGRDVSQFLSSTGAGFTRAISPLGSLTNQVAKMFDPTANDTTQGDAMANFLSKIQDGIPGLANSLPDKEVEGNVITNPNPVAKFFGAVSTEQGGGVQKTSENKAVVTSKTQALSDAGAFEDRIRNILDEDTKLLFDKAKSGKELSSDDVDKLNSGMTKGVTETEDTRFLEEGDYDGNLTVLKVKRELLAADPTTRKETLEAYDQQITRGNIYKDQKTSYDTIKKYKDISLEEWRDLGDPDSDDPNAELYETLFDLDAAMTDSGVSRKSGDSTKPKYYAKAAGKGRGGSRGGGGGGGSGDSSVKSNTIGSTPNIGKFSFGDLAPEKIASAKVPTIQRIRSSDLVKKRTISRRKA